MADGAPHFDRPVASVDYGKTRDRVETYFDKTATRTWERLTSDAPVSGIRATVRAGRDKMRALILSRLPDDLSGRRVLDAGCGTGALAFELAARGAVVTGVDISPQLIDIARLRTPEHLAHRVSFSSGDMLDPAFGSFDHIVAMDSLIYYSAPDIGSILGSLAPRLAGNMVFTVAPRTPLLMMMWRAGKLFPRADRSPTMVPHTSASIAASLGDGQLHDVQRVTSGFYISQALEFTP
ncbi:magnesium protoporphyrin IX methyltransferase [Sulfitobacter sp. S190]|uniref:magnesium protoporphyrin IX methyltransferase n=1 Tax=Sulfitobacter sp. S190 TaxID=2867022 RepID=UPI0021A3734A|nr:magnesium protoporphyrin IX methyltransferase [Sulfitobacter sp. S190]UWR24387.1 magnesium protoporphyrin IX methyltransferase [Sulfitobacter sp. S190]